MSYRITYSVLYLLSLLPFWVLYGLSNFLYFIFYKVIGYRKKIVRENLAQSFLTKTHKERLSIEKKFYRNLCDSIVEGIKMLSASQKTLNKRMIANWRLADETFPGQNAVIMVSHQFNWEWATLLATPNMDKQFLGPYLPITNAVFDRIFSKIRCRFGTIVVPVNDMPKSIKVYKNQNVLWGFVADQTPADTKRCAWVDFFNRKTAFAKGAELLARRYNYPVFFAEFIKEKRGQYSINIKLTFENPNQTRNGEITTAYVRFLENSIKRQPENWVWSHRRWKHSYP